MILSGIALLLGFAREVVVASHFGLSATLDAYIAVLGFHLFFGTQIGNSLENAFISKVAALGGGHHVRANFLASLGSLVVVNIMIAGFVLLFGDRLVGTIFPAFTPQQHALAVKILYALIASIVFANSAGLIRGALNVTRNFSPGFLSGSIISVSTILSVVVFSHMIGIASLVCGFIVGNFLVLVFLATVLKKNGAIDKDSNNDYVAQRFYIWGAAAIVILTEIFYQAFVLTERSFASSLRVGTISAYYYAYTLVSVPVSLLMTPITTTIFPRMSEVFSRNEKDGLRLLRSYGLALITISIAIVISVVANSQFLVRIVFMRGHFSLNDAKRTAELLDILIFLLPFMGVSRLITYSFYSLADYTTPVYCMLFKWLTMIGLGSLLVPRYGARGLALSSVTSLACWFCLLLTLLLLKTRSRRTGIQSAQT